MWCVTDPVPVPCSVNSDINFMSKRARERERECEFVWEKSRHDIRNHIQHNIGFECRCQALNSNTIENPHPHDLSLIVLFIAILRATRWILDSTYSIYFPLFFFSLSLSRWIKVNVYQMIRIQFSIYKQFTWMREKKNGFWVTAKETGSWLFRQTTHNAHKFG